MARLSSSWVSQKEADCYLYCDGSSFNTTVYPKLYAVLGTDTLPDIRDRFLEGSDTPGTVLEAGLPNITGSCYDIVSSVYSSQNNGAIKRSDFFIYDLQAGGGGTVEWMGIQSFNASWSNQIYGASNTVQPPAITVRYYIKAK